MCSPGCATVVTAVKKSANNPPAKKGERKAVLDALGIDKIVEMILDDKSYAMISAELGFPNVRTLTEWLDADANRLACAREARVKSARRCDELALEALEGISDDAPAGMIARQREIASHYRWRAKSRNPREFGDSIRVDAEVKVETVDQVDAMLALMVAKMGPQ